MKKDTMKARNEFNSQKRAIETLKEDYQVATDILESFLDIDSEDDLPALPPKTESKLLADGMRSRITHLKDEIGRLEGLTTEKSSSYRQVSEGAKSWGNKYADVY